MMEITLSYDPLFCRLMDVLKQKYPKELLELDGIGSQLDVHAFSKGFFNGACTSDSSVDANSNVAGRDVITYNYEYSKPALKLNSYYNLWKYLNKKYDRQVADCTIDRQVAGDYYINDAWDIGRPYCFNFSTYDVALEGLKMSDKIDVEPPKSLWSFLRQVEQYTVYCANSTLGATGLADLLIVAAWYVGRIVATGKDHHLNVGECLEDAEKYIYESFVSLIYTLNWQFRGNQSPFTNVSVYDQFFLEEMLPSYIIEDHAPTLAAVQLTQRVFLEAMQDTLSRTPITFPVTTACFSVDADGEIKDDLFLRVISEMNIRYGFINIYCGKTSTLSSCCRLRSDAESLGYSNSFGAGSTKIGSLGVVTLNLPRMANETRGFPEVNRFAKFARKVVSGVRWSASINDAKRQFIQRRINDGFMPLYSLGHMDLSKQYSTCGITGFYEAFEILGIDLLSKEGKEHAVHLMKRINKTLKEMDKEFGAPHNVEQVPAENSSIVLAKKDALLGYKCGERYPFYSNQFLPLTTKADMLDRIEIQGLLDKHFSGGAICHINVAEQITDPYDMQVLIRSCAKHGVIYFAVNYLLKKCREGHISVGLHDTCECGAPIVDEFTRVVGFLTSTKHWRKERREQDRPRRQFY